MIKKFTKPFIYLSTSIVFIILFSVVSYILINGLLNIKPSLFSFKYDSNNVSMFPSIVTTILVVFLSLIIALPVGVCSAIFLSLYAKKKSKLVFFVTLAVETLSSIPSIIYGLFGYILFVIKFRLNYSLISCVLTASIMILPLILKTTQDTIDSMDKKYELGSYALGAGKFYTIRKIILPNILDGILVAVVLSTGRIVGETAAFLYTLGSSTKIPKSIFDSSRTLSIHMLNLSQEGQRINETFATATVLLLIVLVINYISTKITERIKKDG